MFIHFVDKICILQGYLCYWTVSRGEDWVGVVESICDFDRISQYHNTCIGCTINSSLNLTALTQEPSPTACVTLPTQTSTTSPSLHMPLCNTQHMLINLQRTMITAAGNWLLLASRRTTPYTPLIASTLNAVPVARRLIEMLSAVSWNSVPCHKALKWNFCILHENAMRLMPPLFSDL